MYMYICVGIPNETVGVCVCALVTPAREQRLLVHRLDRRQRATVYIAMRGIGTNKQIILMANDDDEHFFAYSFTYVNVR